MAIEEPEELRGTSKHCTVCNAGSTRHTFLYFNNRSVSQPRYVCICCNAEFTHGGKAYHKKKRSRDKQRRHPRPPALVAASPLRSTAPVRQQPASPLREEPASPRRQEQASPAPQALADPVGRRASKRRRNREGTSRELPSAAAAASPPESGPSSPPPWAAWPAPEASAGRVTRSEGKEGERSSVKKQHSASAAAGDEFPPGLEAPAPARSASAAPVRRSTRIAEAERQREQGQRGTDVAKSPADVRQAGGAGPSSGGRGDDEAAVPSTQVRPVSAGPLRGKMVQITFSHKDRKVVRCEYV